jgi:hypothetical protein
MEIPDDINGATNKLGDIVCRPEEKPDWQTGETTR